MQNTARVNLAERGSTFGRISRLLHGDIPEIWVRFLLAIVGLILALAAALFSTVSRESGNLWATLIMASAALVLAAIVGLTTVPYLARRVAAARLRDALDYEVTRVGIIYIVIVLLIGVAALNTGNNLLYIIVAAMLAAILASGAASAIVLRDLEVELHLPEHVFAKRATIGHLVVRNRRRWLPSFSVNVVTSKEPKTSTRWHLKRLIRFKEQRLTQSFVNDSATPIFEGSVFFPYIPPKSDVKAELQLGFDKRGICRQHGFGIATRFPFAFLTKTRRVPLVSEIVVYPSIEPADEFFEVLPLITGEFAGFARGRGYDLYRIREYMPEDSARHVDWKATAKSRSLKVREFSREDERKLRIVFDNPASEVVSANTYEEAVALAASLSWHFAAEDADLSFVAPGCTAGRDLFGFLAYLAVVQPQADRSVLDDLHPFDGYNIIFTTRARGTVPTALWSCSYLVFLQGRT